MRIQSSILFEIYYCTTILIVGFQVGYVESQVKSTWSKLGDSLKGLSYYGDNPFYDDDDFICVDGDSVNPQCFFEYYKDNFGQSVRMSSDGLTVVVGSNSYGNYENETGRVQVFQYNMTSKNWNEKGQSLLGTYHLEAFGHSVAISDDGATIAASSFNIFDDKENDRVYVYNYNEALNLWEQLGSEIRVTEANLEFIGTVEMSSDGSTVAININEMVGGSWLDGYVRVLKFVSNTWEQIGNDISGALELPSAPARVERIPSTFVMSSDGTTIATGIRGRKIYDTPTFPGEQASVVRVSTFNEATDQWEQLGSDIEGIATEDFYELKKTIDISGDGKTIVVAVPLQTTQSYLTVNGAGRVYTFDPLSLQWKQLGDDLNVYSIRNSVAMSSDGLTVAVGESNFMSVFNYKAASGRWSQVEIEPEVQDNFKVGASLDLSADGTIIAIGNPGFISQGNVVEIYKFGPPIPPTMAPTTPAPVRTPYSAPPVTIGAWEQIGETLRGILLINGNNDDFVETPDFLAELFGRSISVSGDGLILAVGASNYGEVELCYGYEDFGRVQVYKYNVNSEKWADLGTSIIGGDSDKFGSSVVLSTDGTTLIVGGEVRVSVYKYNGASEIWEQVGLDLPFAYRYRYTSVSMSSDGSLMAIYQLEPDDSLILVRMYRYLSSSDEWDQVGSDITGDFILQQDLPTYASVKNIPTYIEMSQDGMTIAFGVKNSLENGTNGPRFHNTTILAYEFNSTSDDWEQLGQGINGYSGTIDEGKSMAMSADGKVIVVAAPDIVPAIINVSIKFTEIVKGRGQVYRFDSSSRQWEQLGTDLEVINGATVISSNGNTIGLSTYCTETDGYTLYQCVSVRKYESSTLRWNQVSLIRATRNSTIADKYGFSMDMSSDGAIVAVGAPGQRFQENFVEIYDTSGNIESPVTVPVAAPIFNTPSPVVVPIATPAVDIPVSVPTTTPVEVPVMTTPAPEAVPILVPSKAPTGKVPAAVPIMVPVVVPVVIAPIPVDMPIVTPVRMPVSVPVTPVVIQVPTVKAPTLEPTISPVTSPIPVAMPLVTPVISPVSVPVTSPVATPIMVPVPTTKAPIFPSGCIDCQANFTWSKLGDSLKGLSYFGDNPFYDDDDFLCVDGDLVNPQCFFQFHNDNFGQSIRMSADGLTVAVGSNSYGNYLNETGRVQVFQFNMTSKNWDEKGQSLLGTNHLEAFGHAVALSDDGATIAVSSFALFFDDRENDRVSIYNYNEALNLWEQLGSDIRVTEANLEFIGTVEMSSDGSMVAINLNEKVGGTWYDGYVRVLKFVSNNWEQVGNDISGVLELPSAPARVERIPSTFVMSDDGTTIAMGIRRRKIYDILMFPGEQASVIRVSTFNQATDQWEQLGSDIDGIASEDIYEINKSIAISGDGKTIVVAVPLQTTQSFLTVNGPGRVYKFDPLSLQWTQLGADLNVPSIRNSVAMSSDGITVAVGRVSFVSVFKYNAASGQWFQKDIEPEENDNDKVGASLDLSADGAIIAIGNPELINVGNVVEIYKFGQAIPPTPAPARAPVSPPTTATATPVTIPVVEVPVILPVSVPAMTPVEVPTMTPIVTNTPAPLVVPVSVPSTAPTDKVPVAVPVVSPIVAAPIPVAMPIMTPVRRPVSVPVATPTMVPVPSTKVPNIVPPTNCEIVTFNLYDTRNDTVAAILTNGTVIKNPPPVNRTNIEAVIACNDFGAMNNRSTVELQLYNATSNQMIHQRIERYSKYFLFGDNLRNVYNGRIVPGTYNIRVIVNRTTTSPFTTFTLA